MRNFSKTVALSFFILFFICRGTAVFPAPAEEENGAKKGEEKTFLSSPFDRPEVRRALEALPDVPFAGISGPLSGGITPHHDLAYELIFRFYRELARHTTDVKRVFLFSPDHFRRSRRRGTVCPADWSTSLRILEVDGEAVSALTKNGILERRGDFFAREHGVTIHIPLIAHFFPGARVVPVVIRADAPELDLWVLCNVLKKITKEGDLFILSMDLSHYKTPEGMAAEDVKTLDALLNLRPRDALRIDVDAKRAASLLLSLLKERGATRGILMEHTDSSNILGHRVESGTSYATILYR